MINSTNMPYRCIIHNIYERIILLAVQECEE